MKIQLKQRFIAWLSLLLLVSYLLVPFQASAAQLTSRKLTIGSSQGATSTTHNYTFTAPSATTIKSVDFTYCTAASGTCTTPSGMSSTGGSLASTTNLGSGGSWTGTFTSNGRLQIANNSNTGSPSAGITVNFNAITNPTLSGNQTTFYVRIVTYSDSAWSTPIDSGVVAATVTNQISVTATVDESLNFCAFQTGSTCGAGSGTTVALGTLSSSSATTGTSKLVAGTNAASGYAIQYTGATLTCSGCSGTPSIAATGTTGATSSTGSAQFGINLVSNSSPSVGSNPSGGSGAASTNYGTANTFSFVASSLTQVASASAASADTLYTVSYLANIPSNQTAGSYSTTLTYICTATF